VDERDCDSISLIENLQRKPSNLVEERIPVNRSDPGESAVNEIHVDKQTGDLSANHLFLGDLVDQEDLSLETPCLLFMTQDQC
jgi:hypothetical protein